MVGDNFILFNANRIYAASLEGLISISNVGNFKCDIYAWSFQIIVMQGMTNTGYRGGIKLIRRSASDVNQCLILRFIIVQCKFSSLT